MFNKLQELKEYSKDLRVLYVEDNVDARKFTSELLSRFFKSVEMAEDGLEGLNLFNNNQYDIVITDINMPKMNGIEMVEKIREINTEQKIIAISAHNESDILIELVKAGFNSFALKPIEPSGFFKTLYPVVRDAYTQKLNEELMLQLNEEKEKLNQKVKELQAQTRTIETKHQQVEELLSTQEVDKDTTLTNYFKADEDTHDEVLFLSDHCDDLMEIFNDIPDLINLYIEKQNGEFIPKITKLLKRSVAIFLHYSPYVDVIAESLNDLITAIENNPDAFETVCVNNGEDVLRLFDAVSSDIERYVARFSKESLAMDNIHHIHKPTALSIVQIVQCIVPANNSGEEIEFF